MAILSIILLVLTQTTSALRVAVNQTTSSVSEFQEAREAFEVMTRRISQATLNSYNDTAANTPLTVTGYTRASELRFISGPATLTVTALNSVAGPLLPAASPAYHPTHAIFFQAPLGKASSNAPASLVQMLNTCGYYIEWNSDVNLNMPPAFITSLSNYTYTPRWRYRLMELIEPSDALTIYNDTSGQQTSPSAQASKSWWYNAKDWYQTPYNNGDYYPIADNIVALAFLPMVAPQNATSPAPDGTSTNLAPTYIYDTAPPTAGAPITGPAPVNQPITNALPPLVYVLMIAVDEKSFSAYEARAGNTGTIPTDLGIDPATGTPLFVDATKLQSDIGTVTSALQSKHIKYRVFSSIIPLTAH